MLRTLSLTKCKTGDLSVDLYFSVCFPRIMAVGLPWEARTEEKQRDCMGVNRWWVDKAVAMEGDLRLAVGLQLIVMIE